MNMFKTWFAEKNSGSHFPQVYDSLKEINTSLPPPSAHSPNQHIFSAIKLHPEKGK